MKHNFMRRRVMFMTPAGGYDYGNGHLNKTQNGYNDTLYFNGQKLTVSAGGGTNRGNIDKAIPFRLNSAVINDGQMSGTSGTKAYSCTVSDGCTIILSLQMDSSGYSGYIRSLLVTIDGTSYSLAQAVSSKKIKPLVLIRGDATEQGTNNPLALYDNSEDYDARGYSITTIIFILEDGCTLTGVSFYGTQPFENNTRFVVDVAITAFNRLTVSDRGYGAGFGDLIPLMTGSSAPYGTASASSVQGSDYAYHAFADISNRWTSTYSSAQWIQYDFQAPVHIDTIFGRAFVNGSDYYSGDWDIYRDYGLATQAKVATVSQQLLGATTGQICAEIELDNVQNIRFVGQSSVPKYHSLMYLQAMG